MSVELSNIAQLLEASLDPKQNKQAETALRQLETQPGFSLTLLQLVATESAARNLRLAASLFFKNFIKRRWVDAEGNYLLPENEVVTIKRELIGLMTSVPPVIQTQLGEAISVIADSDFWERWDTLVDDLVSRLTPDNPLVNNGVLQVAHSVFNRWRPLFRSDPLFEEINHVLSKFGGPFIQLLASTNAGIEQNQNNKAVLEQWFNSLELLIKIFYDLSCQDLPPIFEENLQAVSGFLHQYLVYDNAVLHTDDDAEAGVLERVKAEIFEALVLYVQKYEDAFGAFLGQFVSSSWNLLTSVGAETKYDILVSKALQFLTAVTNIKAHAESFNNEETLGQVVEKVILPNLTLRDVDLELFEDEPVEFIRRDLEGVDNDTRRRAATDFLRQLQEQFEQLVTKVVSRYLNHYLAEYSKDKTENWKSKDTAVYLFTSIAAKGTTTAAQGVKSTNPNVDVLDFFQKHVASDLQDESINPLATVDAIKFMYTFRSQITPHVSQGVLQVLVHKLGASNYVIYNYAAIALDRILVLTNDARQPIISRETIVGLSKELVAHLFKLIEKDSAPEKIQENEFLMRCLMRVLIFIREGVLPIYDVVLINLINITKVIRHNPSNPRFYHYLFESIGAVIRYSTPEKSDDLEKRLYGPFADILGEDVAEFVPYVFQLFAALLEANPSGTLTDLYTALIPAIITPSLWSSKGNVTALVRLLSAILPRGASHVVQNNQVEPILGIFQKLISTKVQEAHGFDLLEAVVVNIPAQALQPYFIEIIRLILTRLQQSKTETLTLRFIRFYHLVSASDDKGLGADFFINTSDQVQNDIFKPLYLSIILPDTQKLSRPFDRKTAVVSFTKTLADSQAFVSRYTKGWALTCEALLKLLINPPVPPAADDAILDADIDELSFGVGFTQLNTCKRPPKDPYPEITDVKAWVGQYLRQADSRNNGRISEYVQTRLSETAKQALLACMQG